MKIPYPLVYVEWQDAAHDGGWSHIEEEKDEDLPTCLSVGWVVQMDKKRIVLASSLNLGVNHVGNKQYIPRRMITKYKVFKQKNRPDESR